MESLWLRCPPIPVTRIVTNCRCKQPCSCILTHTSTLATSSKRFQKKGRDSDVSRPRGPKLSQLDEDLTGHSGFFKCFLCSLSTGRPWVASTDIPYMSFFRYKDYKVSVGLTLTLLSAPLALNHGWTSSVLAWTDSARFRWFSIELCFVHPSAKSSGPEGVRLRFRCLRRRSGRHSWASTCPSRGDPDPFFTSLGKPGDGSFQGRGTYK